jgi:osomolarity two-component system sensor histidine kinase SLN1
LSFREYADPFSHSSSSWSRLLSVLPPSYNATATTASISTRWTFDDIPMSPASLEESRGHLTRWNHTLDNSNLGPVAPVILTPPAVTASPTAQRQKKTIRLHGAHRIHVYWGRFRHRLGAGASLSTPSLVEDSAATNNIDFHTDYENNPPGEDNAEVDEVVVDRNWSEDTKSSVSLSEHSISPEKVGSHSADHDSVAVHTGGFWGLCTPLIILRWRLFPAIVNFFSPKFPNEKSELYYIKENWFMRKVRRKFCMLRQSSSFSQSRYHRPSFHRPHCSRLRFGPPYSF